MNTAMVYAFADEASPLLAGQIAAMRRNGLQGLEIRGVDGQNVSDITAQKAAEVRKALDDAGLRVWSVGSPIGKIGLGDDFAAHLDKLRRTVDTARILGTGRIRMFSFYPKEGQTPEDMRGQVLDRLGAMADACEGSGVFLCHENEKGIYGDNAARCLDLLTAEPRLRAVFDPANFVQCGQDTPEAWAMLGSRIDYLHIKDAFFADGRVVPAGKGEGHVPEIVKDYLVRGGTAMTVEPHLTVFAGLQSLEREGGRSAVGTYTYASADEAFDAACAALKDILGEV
ncbi:MAG: sugar phosphate isomerase/epimerase [Clostridia bacterium]|nr:sugar phosphate isomerase/epimerase [Clostridia bacterium]